MVSTVIVDVAYCFTAKDGINQGKKNNKITHDNPPNDTGVQSVLYNIQRKKIFIPKRIE
jgi:hypothetical protein